MIVRSMLENPDQPFDFFNDYKDTIHFLAGVLLVGDPVQASKAQKAIPILETRFAKWHIQSMKK